MDQMGLGWRFFAFDTHVDESPTGPDWFETDAMPAPVKRPCGPIGAGRVSAKIVTEATPGPKANIRCLTFHYREIFTRLLAQVGFGRAPTKIAQKRTPAS